MLILLYLVQVSFPLLFLLVGWNFFIKVLLLDSLCKAFYLVDLVLQSKGVTPCIVTFQFVCAHHVRLVDLLCLEDLIPVHQEHLLLFLQIIFHVLRLLSHLKQRVLQ